MTRKLSRRSHSATVAALLFISNASGPSCSEAFSTQTPSKQRLDLQINALPGKDELFQVDKAFNYLTSAVATAALSASLLLGASTPSFAENELAAIYGGKGFDSSLVDQTCLVDKCSLQAKACLADDPDCRKGLTCTAKCLGDNTCITGCMARYGDSNLDDLLKCTIEDNSCIKIAILDGGADKFGEEPRPPAPTVNNFKMNTMEGQWYKVVGYNPNYDCYACQKNTFSAPESSGYFGKANDKLEVDVQFSMPRMMPDGTPPPPRNERESITVEDGLMYGSQSIGFNDYETHETMVFDSPSTPKSEMMSIVLGRGTSNEANYRRTAHSEGEMFGLSKSIFHRTLSIKSFCTNTFTVE